MWNSEGKRFEVLFWQRWSSSTSYLQLSLKSVLEQLYLRLYKLRSYIWDHSFYSPTSSFCKLVMSHLSWKVFFKSQLKKKSEGSIYLTSLVSKFDWFIKYKRGLLFSPMEFQWHERRKWTSVFPLISAGPQISAAL